MRNSTKAAALGAGLGMVALALLTPSLASGNARNRVGSGFAAARVATPFVAYLTGPAEVPGPGDADGTGAASVTIDGVTGEICVDLRVANIDTASAAHIHRGSPNGDGPIVVDFGAFLPQPVSEGCVMATPALAADIASTPLAFYVNVHNAAFPGGAVRGQLTGIASITGATRLLEFPLRAYDSRNTSPPMIPGETRTIDLATGSNGVPGGAILLGVPAGSTAAVLRITVTDTAGPGFLKAYNAAFPSAPPTAAVNWDRANAIVGSDAVVAVDNMGRIKLAAGATNTGSTHVVVDVLGFVF